MNALSRPIRRCAWCTSDPLYQIYHDQEWGMPNFDDHYLFAMLCLEGNQAGLSWLTVLKKRAHYYNVFANFDPLIIAQFDDHDIDRLMQDAGLIRHRGKLNAIINNARCYLKVTEQQSFSDYLWAMSPNGLKKRPQCPYFATAADVPVRTAASDAMAKQLKKDGFKFVGSTICYAFMQAVGMVNDHTADCDFACTAINSINPNTID